LGAGHGGTNQEVELSKGKALSSPKEVKGERKDQLEDDWSFKKGFGNLDRDPHGISTEWHVAMFTTPTHMHTQIHTYIHTHTHTHIRTYTHARTHTYIHMHTHTYIHTHTRTKPSCLHSHPLESGSSSQCPTDCLPPSQDK
jgi:hypothetical protein